MKYVWHSVLGLFSVGFIGLIVGVVLLIGLFSYYAMGLPDYDALKDYEPPIVTRIYASDGRLMAEFAQEKRVFVPIENIPQRVKNAFVAAEDKKFYKHGGIDYIGIVRAILSNVKNLGTGRRPEGASTITQQVAKNFLLSSEVSYIRKIKEAILATRMERALTKSRLLELYLNEIYLGQRAYGVGAAALHYFGKALPDLTIAEIGYLAALPKAPNNYHPVRHYERAFARRNWVIKRMAIEGYISESEADLAQLEPLKTVTELPQRRVKAPYFAEEVRRTLLTHYGAEELYTAGFVVRSTLDAHIQKVAQKSLRSGLEAYDRRHGYRGPFMQFDTLDDWRVRLGEITRPLALPDDWSIGVVLDLPTQAEAVLGFSNEELPNGLLPLKEMQWARAYKNQGYALGPKITAVSDVVKKGDVILVQKIREGAAQTDRKDTQTPDIENPTYTLKQIPDVQGAILAMDAHTGRVLAMQGGWKYRYGSSEFNRTTQAMRQPGSAFKPFVYMAALENGFTPATLVLDAPFVLEDRPGHFWSPTNYTDKYYGPTPIRVGIEKSKNLMTVRLADYLGMDVVAHTAARFGIHEDMPPLLSYSLGAGETRLMDLVSAYAVIVNGGKSINPTLLDRIQDRRGATVFRHDTRPCIDCGALIRWDAQSTPQPPDTRKQITDPRVAYQMTSILQGVIQRGTGRKIDQLGLPLAGKTGTTNASKDAWFIGFSPDLVVGVFIGFDEPRSLGKKESGSSVAVPIFKDFMQDALAEKPIVPFRTPPGIRNVRINAKTGSRAKLGDQDVIWEAFVEGTEPTEDVFILDGNRIRHHPSIQAIPDASSRDAHTGTGGLY